MHELAGAFEKIKRADFQIKSLAEEMKGFANNGTYRGTLERHRCPVHQPRSSSMIFTVKQLNERRILGIRGGEWLADGRARVPYYDIDYLGVVVRVQGDIPALEWGVLVGEITHDLRSALDHLMWRLSMRYRGMPPVGPYDGDNPWRRVQFPIVLWHEDLWPTVPAQLWGLVDAPQLRARIKDLQPRGERDDLWVLQELWNRDKHQDVSFVATNMAFHGVDITPQRDRDFDADAIEVRPVGPVEDGTELAVVQMTAHPGKFVRNVPMHVETRLTFDVAFGEGWPAYGEHVERLLQRLYDRVAAILIDFEPEFLEPLPVR